MRNRVIEYLESVSTREAQREYERSAPAFVNVPYELIEEWRDHVPQDWPSGGAAVSLAGEARRGFGCGIIAVGRGGGDVIPGERLARRAANPISTGVTRWW